MIKKILISSLIPITMLSYHYGKKTSRSDAFSSFNQQQNALMYNNLPACHPTQDPLTDLINDYHTNPQHTTSLDEIKKKLNIQMYGKPTTKDLEELLKASQEYTNTTSLSPNNIGIKEIIIFPQSEQQEVDYIGLSIPYLHQLRLFSKKILQNGIIYHEFTHFYLDYLNQEKPLEYYSFIIPWNISAGFYNKVIPIQKRGLIDIISYKDNTQGAKLGYIHHYGGKSIDEDICMHVSTIKTSPQIFETITDSFEIYEEKIFLLYKHNLITPAEKETALKYLTTAKTKIGQVDHKIEQTEAPIKLYKDTTLTFCQ